MTVSAANAGARTSFTACLENAGTQSKPYDIVASARTSADDWLRVKVDIYKLRTRSFSGDWTDREGLYFVGPDKRTFFKLAPTNSESVPATRVTDINTYSTGLEKSVVDRRYALAYVADDGDVVGFAWQSNGGTHCKKSCYSSVIAQAGRRRWL